MTPHLDCPTLSYLTLERGTSFEGRGQKGSEPALRLRTAICPSQDPQDQPDGERRSPRRGSEELVLLSITLRDNENSSFRRYVLKQLARHRSGFLQNLRTLYLKVEYAYPR